MQFNIELLNYIVYNFRLKKKFQVTQKTQNIKKFSFTNIIIENDSRQGKYFFSTHKMIYNSDNCALFFHLIKFFIVIKRKVIIFINYYSRMN